MHNIFRTFQHCGAETLYSRPLLMDPKVLSGFRRSSGLLLRCLAAGTPAARGNSNAASVTRVKRATYVRSYPTVLVQPDGSTINVRYHEPRQLIKVTVRIHSKERPRQNEALSTRLGLRKVSRRNLALVSEIARVSNNSRG